MRPFRRRSTARQPVKGAIRRGAVALFLAAALPLTAPNGALQAAEALSLTIPQARQVAVKALATGQAELAAQIANGLLQRDPTDAFAHFVLARAFQQLKQPKAGQKQAALAFRHAKSGIRKYEASQLAARLAVENGRPGLAQVWLRRSWNHAPDDQARKVLSRDYRVLRAVNPWNWQARLSVTPSNNVNNGAEDPYAVIDGLPLVGVLSSDALALSGVKMVADTSVAYRFAQTDRSQTRVTSRLYLSRVALSDEAQAQAPTARNADFAYSKLELGLEHRIALGKERGMITWDGAISQSWYGGAAYQDALRLGVARMWPLAAGHQAEVSLGLEHARAASGGVELTQIDLRARVARELNTGATLQYGLALQMVDSDFTNAKRRRGTVYLAYGLPQKLGPAKVSMSIGGSLGDYYDYRVGPFIVPGGREDRTLFGSADFIFEQLDYAGFVPSLKIQAQKTRSNVSRFETNEMSVSLGFVSRF
jgi:hypothetical protein